MNAAEQLAVELLAGELAHPLLPLPDVANTARLLRQESGRRELTKLLEWRRGVIARAQADPLFHELEPDFWKDGRQALADKIKVLILLGGNRSSKSRLCGKLVVEALWQHPGTMIVCVSEDETASRETQQKIIWHYLPAAVKARCHNKRDPAGLWYVQYTEANGFSERKLVLPHPNQLEGKAVPGDAFPSKVLFGTYNEAPDDYEGLEFGHRSEWTVGWWADENLRLNWLQMFTRRGKFRPGTGLWSYTPIHGITPTIKEAVGAARTLKHRPSKLLLDRVNLPGLPKGTMPYIQEPALPNGRVIYFHSEMSPFGPGPNGSGKPYAESVAEDCKDRPSEYVMRIAYGYTEDVIGRCYPKFRGDVHVVAPEALPAAGTNYCFMDPAGGRNWFILWVRVSPGNPRRFYIYREWPDLKRYGEWAVPSTRSVTSDSRKGWDGEQGPAQRNQGWGTSRYKQLLLAEETVTPTLGNLGVWTERDPHRRWLLDEAVKGAGFAPVVETQNPDGTVTCHWNAAVIEQWKATSPPPVREQIRVRKVDPRAMKNPTASEQGGVNIQTLFAAEDRNAKGEVEGPRMVVLAAYSGKGIDDGIAHVNGLLDYDERQPVCPVLNEPRLYVASECKAVIWMFENYTNRGGEEAGAKDPADLVRYIAQDDDLRHVSGEGTLKVGGFREGPV